MEQVAPLVSTAGYINSRSEVVTGNEANSSGVSWAAVIAGAFVTAALSLILLALGAGLGLSSVSLGSHTSVSSGMIGAAAILWLILMQLMSSSMGGYLAGRLRTKWTSVHTDEVYFRDTAHGFLSWAVALVITAAFLASAAASMLGVRASTDSAASARDGQELGSNGYFVDALFRSDNVKPDSGDASARGEAGRIFVTALGQGSISTTDRSYLDQLIAARTGLSQSDSDKRLSDTFANAQQTAETARKTTAHSLLWTFLALLIGAFCASLAATIGGRQRDHVVTV